MFLSGQEEPANKEGGTINHFMMLAKSTGVEHRVRFLAPMTPEQLAELYCVADAVLLPSHRETFGKVLVEGGLAGKPLATTSACGSAGLIVQDGVKWVRHRTGDISQLARAMTQPL
ncbi:MAG: glycosyltransferase [Terracidiphilus sp.]